MATLSLHGLRKVYGDLVALDDVSLDIQDGEFFVLLGPSGAGKTTTLKCVAGLETPTAGRVEIGGRDMSNVEPNARHVAMAFENYALYPQMTVFENIVFPLRSKRYRLPPAEAKQTVERVAETLGIGHLLQRAPAELSGGQRQRVALARVLVRPADVFLLDEPLSHLDAKLRAAMRAELKSLGEVQHTTSLYVTHDYLEALALGDRIAVLREGKLVQVGTREDVWHRPADTFVARAFGQPEINLIAGTVVDGPDARAFRSQDGSLVLPIAGLPISPGAEVEIGLRPRDLTLASSHDGQRLDDLIFEGKVYVVEPLGRQVEVTVDVGANRIAFITEAQRAELEPDAPVTIRLPHARLLVFDRVTGTRIDVAPVAPEVAARA